MYLSKNKKNITLFYLKIAVILHIKEEELGNDKTSKEAFGLNQSYQSRHGVIKKVIVINCNFITFSKLIECNCN